MFEDLVKLGDQPDARAIAIGWCEREQWYWWYLTKFASNEYATCIYIYIYVWNKIAQQISQLGVDMPSGTTHGSFQAGALMRRRRSRVWILRSRVLGCLFWKLFVWLTIRFIINIIILLVVIIIIFVVVVVAVAKKQWPLTTHALESLVTSHLSKCRHGPENYCTKPYGKASRTMATKQQTSSTEKPQVWNSPEIIV